MKTSGLCANIEAAIHSFRLEGTVTGYQPYGNGHINDTFLLCTKHHASEGRYILQRINHRIFQNPQALMANISGVTNFLHQKIRLKGGDPLRETLNLIKTRDGSDFYQDGIGCYWRCYLFISGTICYEQVEAPADFYQSGRSFGSFQNLLADYPAASLNETIPNFHHTPRRFEALLSAAAKDVCKRKALVLPELEFISKRKEQLALAVRMEQEGLLPVRVTHNDTKLNNVLIDKETGKGICVIDLDTIMPGLSINDFGDAIRFGANTALEDETNSDKISLSLSLFDIYAKGFLEGCEGRLTQHEVRMLPMGAKLMTLECGIRFLTDYLQGDIYFKTHRAGHNLDRARNQLKLVSDMEDKWDAMTAIIAKYR